MAATLWTAKIEIPSREDLTLEDEVSWPLSLNPTPNYSLYEDPDKGTFVLDIFLETKPTEKDLEALTGTVSYFLGGFEGPLHFKEIKQQDWVAKSLESLKPLEVGRFFVHGEHDADKIPTDKTALQIEASLAFGTGHHETTRGCLLALENLENIFPKTILDLGTGSGILAIAAANLWPRANIFASDNDPEAITKAKENARINKTPDIKFFVAEGFEHDDFSEKSYELITANILAGPLIELAADIAAHLNCGGLVILAGLLEGQKEEVLKAYKNGGFKLKGETSENGWPTLILEKI
ncbi:MAG: 50S ribosomal protein L11 methyltransferase [Sphingomonadales bacterium]